MTATPATADSPYDPLDPTDRDPIEQLAEARKRCPVSQPRPGVFVVARHTDVKDALQDPGTYSSEDDFVLEGGTPTAALPATVITMLDAPAHTALRARLRQWFAPPRLRREEPRIRGIVSGVLADLRPGQPVEVWSTLGRAIPARTVYAFLGLPEQDWERLHQWADVVNRQPPRTTDRHAGVPGTTGYLGEQLAAGPPPATGEDVLDGLAHPADGEPPLTPVEAVIHAFQLTIAGTDTTASLITNLLHELLVDRSHWERLLADRTLVPAAIEESLRHDAPLQYVLRTVNEEREISGCPVKPGDRLAVSLQSANWDERAWGPDAAGYSLDRPAGQATTMAFGYGIHTCLGAPLARLEARLLRRGAGRALPGHASCSRLFLAGRAALHGASTGSAGDVIL